MRGRQTGSQSQREMAKKRQVVSQYDRVRRERQRHADSHSGRERERNVRENVWQSVTQRESDRDR